MDRKKILVVEDDPDQMRSIGIRLKASGYDISFAADGIQAVGTARRERPDLILLDLGLPGGDGYVVMDRIKAMSHTSFTPVIVFSARDAAVHRPKALKAGAYAFMEKPVDNGTLLGVIKAALK